MLAAAAGLCLAVAVPALAAEEPSEPPAEPTAAPTAAPTATASPDPTPTLATPAPTATDEPPAPTATPTEPPTATPAPTASPSATPTSSAAQILYGASLRVRFADGEGALANAALTLSVEFPDGGIQAWRALTDSDGEADLEELPYPSDGAPGFDWEVSGSWSGVTIEGPCRTDLEHSAEELVAAAEGEHSLELTPDESTSSITCEPTPTPEDPGDGDDSGGGTGGGGGNGGAEEGGVGGGPVAAPRSVAPALTPPLTDAADIGSAGQPLGLAGALLILAGASIFFASIGQFRRARR